MTTATIFYIDSQWMRKDANPFGVRYDAQILPSGSVVAGFLVRNPQGVQELLDPPALFGEQEQAWQSALEEARAILRGEYPASAYSA